MNYLHRQTPKMKAQKDYSKQKVDRLSKDMC